MSDLDYMHHAMDLAHKAELMGEVPVGAIIVKDGEIVGEGFNQPISHNDPTAHAEIMALRAAAKQQDNYRLPGASLFVTLEPCAMCAGALVHARIERVVIALEEPRSGAAGSIMNILQNPQLNHRCEVEFGLMKEESKALIQGFFKRRRKN